MFQQLGWNCDERGWSLGVQCVERWGGWEWDTCRGEAGGTEPLLTATPPPSPPTPRSGWISALMVLKASTAVAVLMLLVALFFTGIAVLGVVMLQRVRGLEQEILCPQGRGGTFCWGVPGCWAGSELMDI